MKCRNEAEKLPWMGFYSLTIRYLKLKKERTEFEGQKYTKKIIKHFILTSLIKVFRVLCCSARLEKKAFRMFIIFLRILFEVFLVICLPPSFSSTLRSSRKIQLVHKMIFSNSKKNRKQILVVLVYSRIDTLVYTN